jgi:protein kinase A
LTKDAKDRLGTLKDGSEEVKSHIWFKPLNFDQYALKQSKVKVPWKPPIKSNTDTSLFESAADDDHIDNHAIDIGGDWDNDF